MLRSTGSELARTHVVRGDLERGLQLLPLQTDPRGRRILVSCAAETGTTGGTNRRGPTERELQVRYRHLLMLFPVATSPHSAVGVGAVSGVAKCRPTSLTTSIVVVDVVDVRSRSSLRSPRVTHCCRRHSFSCARHVKSVTIICVGRSLFSCLETDFFLTSFGRKTTYALCGCRRDQSTRL